MTTDNTPQPILLNDYKAPAYLVSRVQLNFDLDPGHTRVRSNVFYKHNPGHPRSLYLDGKALRLIKVSINQKNIPLETLKYSEDFLLLENLPESFELELITEINPKANLALEGLYLSHNKFYTQCEPEGFRRITYFLDRPDVMAEYETTIHAALDQYPILLSNGNLIEQGISQDGKHFVKWHDPFPKPSYLFALVAGNLSRVSDTFTTQSGRKVALHIYVEEENLPKCKFALDAIKRAMRWDEQVYGLEYDLDLFMVVAVSDFNMGAMENKGLNIFNSKYILASPETATDEDFEKILAVIGHEYFHNWTGNRVTLRDWFQLSLKEGLTVFRDQEFSADEGSRAVKRIRDVRLLREQQFPEDGGPMAHPVRPESYIEINNFYTATVYHKGAEIIRMMHTIIGPKKFRKAMDLFFETYDGHAVTVEDFLNIVEKSSGQAMQQFKLWYLQAGTPRIQALHSYDAKTQSLKLQLSQELPETPDQSLKKPQLIPLRIALFGQEGKALESVYQGQSSHEHLLLFDQSNAEFVLHAVLEAAVPSLLRNFSAPVLLNSNLTRQELYTLLAADTDPFNKYEAAQTLALQTIQHWVTSTSALRDKELDPQYIRAFQNLLGDRAADPRLIAMSVQAPSTDYLMHQGNGLDIETVFEARRLLLQQLASSCRVELLACYERTKSKTFAQDREAISKRDLNNACLNLLAQLKSSETIELAHQHFLNSTNMTDTIGALTALSSTETPVRLSCLEQFYVRWKSDPLVIDKWFQVQASSEHTQLLEHVRALLQHPDFDIYNPNRVYSVFRSFNKANPHGLHHKSGQGYTLLAEYVQRIDKSNPQVAAMLAGGFSRFRKYDPERQQLMRAKLKELTAVPNISRDVFEVLSKSLASD